MAMVDEFLDLLTEDYTTLYKENATLKAKMKVLVEKVEEYRSTEDAMRKALLTAQKMADEMVAEAEARKTELLSQAEAVAKARMVQLQKAVAEEQSRLTAAQASTTAYLGKLRELHQHEMDYLTSLSELTVSEPAGDPISDAASDISASVERLVAQARAEAAPAPAPEEDTRDLSQPVPPTPEKEGGLYAELMELNLNQTAAQGGAVHTAHTQEEGSSAPRHTHEPAAHYPSPVQEVEDEDIDDAPTRRLDFSNLQFGKDYEIR